MVELLFFVEYESWIVSNSSTKHIYACQCFSAASGSSASDPPQVLRKTQA